LRRAVPSYRRRYSSPPVRRYVPAAPHSEPAPEPPPASPEFL